MIGNFINGLVGLVSAIIGIILIVIFGMSAFALVVFALFGILFLFVCAIPFCILILLVALAGELLP